MEKSTNSMREKFNSNTKTIMIGMDIAFAVIGVLTEVLQEWKTLLPTLTSATYAFTKSYAIIAAST